MNTFQDFSPYNRLYW